ncbi:MAG: hypothetical protein JXQ29_08465 [Planctomycetes bacterium]|nr:hypothetical protein [Planctomycetota bacterium]
MSAVTEVAGTAGLVSPAPYGTAEGSLPIEVCIYNPHFDVRLDERGAATLSLDAPAQHVSYPALHVTVEHHGALVMKRVAIPIQDPASRRIVWETRSWTLLASARFLLAADQDADLNRGRFAGSW